MFELTNASGTKIAVGKYAELKLFSKVEKLENCIILPLQ